GDDHRKQRPVLHAAGSFALNYVVPAKSGTTDPHPCRRRKGVPAVARTTNARVSRARPWEETVHGHSEGFGSRRIAQRTRAPSGSVVPPSTTCCVFRGSPEPR